MKLYEIQKDIEELLDQVDFETGEIPPEISYKLAIREENKLVKVGNYVYRIKNLRSDVKELADEIKRLEAIKKARQSEVNYLTNLLDSNLHGERIKQPTWSISYLPKDSIDDTDLDQEMLEEIHKTNPELVEKKIIYQLDKKLAMDTYKKTGVLPKNIKVITKQNIQVK